MRSLPIVMGVVAALSSPIATAAVAEPCQRTYPLAQSLAAQQDAMQAQLIRTHDCSLVPRIIAFNRGANARMARAIAATHGECSWSTPQVSEAQLTAILRSQCAVDTPRTNTPTVRTSSPAVRTPRARVSNPGTYGPNGHTSEPTITGPTVRP